MKYELWSLLPQDLGTKINIRDTIVISDQEYDVLKSCK